MSKFHFDQHPHLPPLLISVAFGFAAGAVGMIVAFAYALPEQAGLVSGSAPRTVIVPAEDPAPATELANSAVYFVDRAVAERAGADRLRSVVPNESFGSGFVLTSDGWLVAHALSFPKAHRAQDSFAVINGRTYRVINAVPDEFSGLVFLRVEAAGLPVAAFGSADDLSPGGSAFTFDVHGGIRRLGVIAHNDIAAANAAELRHSSERLQHVVHLSGADQVLPGSMILSRKGEIVAVYAGADAAGAYAVPRDSFAGVIGGVLSGNSPQRPYLGVQYFDLSRAVTSAQIGKGALLVAVTERSPAAIAGLRIGDVILSVNDQEISAKVPLSDLLSDYGAGDAVSLVYSRSGAETRVEIKLGSAAQR